MMLHVFVAGREVLREDVEPGRVEELLSMIDSRLIGKDRLTVTLDSGVHKNVTYLLNRRGEVL